MEVMVAAGTWRGHRMGGKQRKQKNKKEGRSLVYTGSGISFTLYSNRPLNLV